MTYQPDKLNYYSGDGIDKVVAENIDTPLTYSVPDLTTQNQTLTNPYGIKCFITMSFSVDGTNYYPAQSVLTDLNPTTANAWVDATSIYLVMENFSGSTKTFYIKYALDTIT